MTVDKIDNSLSSQNLLNERLKEAASGKKTNVHNINAYSTSDVNNSSSDSMVFSDDAKKLQETEVILRNALQKLHEMDEINEDSLNDINEKLADDFYSNNDEVGNELADLLIPENEMRENIQKRMKADEFVDQISKFDEEETPIDNEKLAGIKEKISSGFYSQDHIISSIADNILTAIQ